MTIRDVLIAGKWRAADSTGSFHATNPATTEPLAEEFPVSSWADCDAALDAAVAAHRQLGTMPDAAIADFLEAYATAIEARAESLVAAAHAETALPTSPRLADVELPRTTGQLAAFSPGAIVEREAARIRLRASCADATQKATHVGSVRP